MNTMRCGVSAFILAGLIGAAPNGYADDCATLKQIMAQAPHKFASLKGEFEDTVEGSKFYRAKVSLTALHDCSYTEHEDGESSVTCGNGAGRSYRPVPLDTADKLVSSCGFRVRDMRSFDRGRRTSRTYNVITDDRQLVVISTSSFDGSPRKPVHLRVARP